jgi:hypothetical protein
MFCNPLIQKFKLISFDLSGELWVSDRWDTVLHPSHLTAKVGHSKDERKIMLDLDLHTMWMMMHNKEKTKKMMMIALAMVLIKQFQC